MATVAALGTWLRFVAGLRGESQPGSDQPAKRQIRVLGIPLLGLVHPIPWLAFAGLPTSAYYFIWVRESPKATWFFGALGCVILLWLFGSVALYLRLRKRKGTDALARATDAMPSNKSLERTRD